MAEENGTDENGGRCTCDAQESGECSHCRRIHSNPQQSPRSGDNSGAEDGSPQVICTRNPYAPSPALSQRWLLSWPGSAVPTRIYLPDPDMRQLHLVMSEKPFYPVHHTESSCRDEKRKEWWIKEPSNKKRESQGPTKKPKDKMPLLSSSSEADIKTNGDQDNKKKRCVVCKKRLGHIKFTCHCMGGPFCISHRYADLHFCTYDFRNRGREEIRRNNPRINGEKINKI